jgi:hypothetical protein
LHRERDVRRFVMGLAMNRAQALEQVRRHRLDALLVHCQTRTSQGAQAASKQRMPGSSKPFVGNSAC